jgi:hypothetical protein
VSASGWVTGRVGVLFHRSAGINQTRGLASRTLPYPVAAPIVRRDR